jgi:outer membrane usher protein
LDTAITVIGLVLALTITNDDEYTDLSRLQYSNLISVNSNKSLTNTYFATKNSGTFGVGYINTKANDFKNRFLNLSWALFYRLI